MHTKYREGNNFTHSLSLCSLAKGGGEGRVWVLFLQTSTDEGIYRIQGNQDGRRANTFLHFNVETLG